ncbi:trypsin-like cysteine/serine peptidase domain-containing protein [Syncephalis fuscata]|nr:trypsin-like cysteine/serine peptidase domain-containing protein [Syncephalis fuscata]
MQPTGWQSTIELAVKAIVSIRFSQVAAFDTEGAETSEASGFIVDAERGIILTNRHVACSGPFVGEAIAHDHEEVDVHAIYRDPIHDFGFLKFDPSKIRYMPVTAIPLRPDLARVGLDIRVVGNDAGEKLSILAGSISRLDRNAPEYGDMTYNDFNTFYFSGSPVIDLNGNAVALQAGGHTKAATDFFLPLDRVVRALQCLQRNEPVVRGTIQVQFLHRPFDETRRLGLKPETEATVREQYPEEIGMLVVETVVPEGPGSAELEEGDILIRINGQTVTKFVSLEEALDSHVNHDIVLEIERGGEALTVTVTVQNLHSITPDRYVEIGGATLNELSYQLARSYCVPARGVYVAEPAGMFRLDGPDNGWIIASVDSQLTPTLDDFIRVMQSIPDRERHADVHMTSVAVVQVDRHWSRFRLAVRNDVSGLWKFTDLNDPAPAVKELEPATVKFVELDDSLGSAKQLISSLVKVTYYMPIKLDGFPRSRKQGAGLVVDAERGLVVVGRNIVPFALGDLSITFADSIVIPAKVEFLHPTHNVAMISYDPRLLGETPVQSAQLSDTPLVQGHKVTLLAFNHNYRPVCLTTVVTDITCVTIPQNATPRFRGINLDAITLDTPLAQQCSSGVLADHDGRVQGLWLSYLGERTVNGHDNEYHLGLHVNTIRPILEPLRLGQRPQLRVLSVELVPVQMVQARHMGVSDDWVRQVEVANPQRHQLFMIRRVETASVASQWLKDLDLILAINGKVLTRMVELDAHVELESLSLTILREKKEMTVQVPTTPVDGEDVRRVLSWAGAMIQEPHKAVLQQSKKLPSRVYISARSRGSPAYMYGMVPTMWITHVNGQATPDVDAFLAVVRTCPDNTYVRIKIITFDMILWYLVLSKTSITGKPTTLMERDDSADCGWRSSNITK